MTLSPLTRRVLALVTGLALLVVYAPLALVLLNSFNTSRTFAWPPPGSRPSGGRAAWQSEGAREALWTSVEVAVLAT